ncbi:Non-specific lipid-transfer protein [Hibiscus syriacus]|uniref:Non-specific lipid-transfer protein n=1 Tax=Hibiscus syriacus TaxID=106335 RepID=A0A6A2WQE7_HIBSY|nr:Non-specific lipid-transfer protein [Hibiscus syriacus]
MCGGVVLAVVGAPLAQGAINCGKSHPNWRLHPYLKGPGGGAVPPACCSGIKTLNGEAQTTPDRQAACNCLKSAAATITGINLNLASGLPGKCGVSIPYQISPSTDCKSVK